MHEKKEMATKEKEKFLNSAFMVQSDKVSLDEKEEDKIDVQQASEEEHAADPNNNINNDGVNKNDKEESYNGDKLLVENEDHIICTLTKEMVY